MFSRTSVVMMVYAAIIIGIRSYCRRNLKNIAAKKEQVAATPVDSLQKYDSNVLLLHKIYSLPNFFDAKPLCETQKTAIPNHQQLTELSLKRARNILDSAKKSSQLSLQDCYEDNDESPYFPLEFKAPRRHIFQSPHGSNICDLDRTHLAATDLLVYAMPSSSTPHGVLNKKSLHARGSVKAIKMKLTKSGKMAALINGKDAAQYTTTTTTTPDSRATSESPVSLPSPTPLPSKPTINMPPVSGSFKRIKKRRLSAVLNGCLNATKV